MIYLKIKYNIINVSILENISIVNYINLMRILILIFFLFFTSANSDEFEQKNKLNKLFNQLEKVSNNKTAELLEDDGINSICPDEEPAPLKVIVLPVLE